MLAIHNETPFDAQLAVCPDIEGVETLVLAVRATFSITEAGLRVAERQRPVDLADTYRGDPHRSSLLRAADLHLPKPGTDVVLLGDAMAPGGRPATQLDVTLTAGPVRKTVRVFGPREWTQVLGRISAPEPFERMPLVYERAFGGTIEVHPITRVPVVDLRNPVGVGFARLGKDGPASARALPNLEDPESLLSAPTDVPAPAGFGFIAPHWQPRSGRAGTYDDVWKKKRAPYLPEDFDLAFYHAAPPDLVCAKPLSGGEAVRVVNASPSGLLRFRIPRCKLDVRVQIGRAVETPHLRLATVCIEADAGVLGLTYQGSVRCDKKKLAIESVHVALDRLDLEGRSA